MVAQAASTSQNGSNGGLLNVSGSGGPPISRATFRQAPHGSLRLGQLPPTRNRTLNFPSPTRVQGNKIIITCGANVALKTLKFSLLGTTNPFNRFSRVHKRERNGNGTIFIKLAPIDLNGNSPSVIPKPNQYNFGRSSLDVIGQGHGGPNPYSYANSTSGIGLGGVPKTGLIQRFSRLWPGQGQSQDQRSPGPETTSSMSQTASSNLLEALSKRKRYDLAHL